LRCFQPIITPPPHASAITPIRHFAAAAIFSFRRRCHAAADYFHFRFADMPPDYSADLPLMITPTLCRCHYLRHYAIFAIRQIFSYYSAICCRRFSMPLASQRFLRRRQLSLFRATADISHYFAISHYCRRHAAMLHFAFAAAISPPF
jgi:hypothetical protein